MAKVENEIHQISDNLALQVDSSFRNMTLLERYELSDGRGKKAQKTGEFGWRPRTGGAYYTSPSSLAYGLFKQDGVQLFNEHGWDYDKVIDGFNKALENYEKFFNEKIVFNRTVAEDDE